MKDKQVDEKYLMGLSDKIMYFWNDEVECYIRSVPEQGYWAKFKGKAEYRVNGTTDMVITAIMSGKVATKAEYEGY